MFSISPPYDSLAYGFQVVLNVLWSAVFLDMFFSFCFAHFAKVCSCYSLLLLSSSHFLFLLIQHHDKKIFCSSLQEPEMNEFQKKRLTIEEVSCCMWGSCKTKTVNSTYSIMSSLLLVPDACTWLCMFDCMKWADWGCITIGNIYSCINVVSFNTILFVAFL